jgi:hypothetical protein
MADSPRNPSASDAASIHEAIQTFETILEVFPEDVNALESLIVSYEKLNDAANMRLHAQTLIQLLMREGDWVRVLDFANRLLKADPTDPDAQAYQEEAQKHVQTALAAGAAAAAASPQKTVITKAPLTFDLRGELDLAWSLLQANIITQEQYEAVIERLTESSRNAQGEAPLSILQELREMERVDLDKIIAFLAADAGVPFIELSHCECPEETLAMLPLPLAKRLGIMPFDQVENELLVAVLNPVDLELRKRVTKFFGTKVHFFFTSPDEFLQGIARQEERLKKANDGSR